MFKAPTFEKWNLAGPPFRVPGLNNVRHCQVGEDYFREGMVLDAFSFEWRAAESGDRFPACLKVKGGRMPGFRPEFRGIAAEFRNVARE